MPIISPSLLAADFGNLERDIKMINESRAEWIHIDVMDGLFVPNISFGFPILEAVRRCSSKVLDLHLMIVEPERYFARAVAAGASRVTFHIEATRDCHAAISALRGCGAEVGVAIKPSTPVDQLREFIEDVDLILVMSVEPGFGAQRFIEESLTRISAIRAMIDEIDWSGRKKPLIEVDGGISEANSRALYAAGAEVLVAGSAIFKAENPMQMISELLHTKKTI